MKSALSVLLVNIPYSSGTIDSPMGQPAGKSRICLSCHDGVNATVVSSYGTMRNFPRGPRGGVAAQLY